MAILLVDDNLVSLDLQKIMMESYGLSVETATRGEQAVQLASEKDYSLILMDIHMPGIDGFTATSQIREFNKKVPIVALTASEITEEECFACGMNAALKKPLKLSDIRTTLSPFVELDPEDQSPWRRKTDILFDLDELKLNLGDDVAVMMILQRFLAMHIRDCDKLNTYLTNGDFAEAQDLLHDIVGIAGNLYCCRLYETAFSLNKDLDKRCTTRLPIFNVVWKQTIGTLSEWCNNLAAHSKPHAEQDDSDWSIILSDFISLCHEFDINATELFNNNVNMFARHMRDTEFDALNKAINSYDFLSIIENMEAHNV